MAKSKRRAAGSTSGDRSGLRRLALVAAAVGVVAFAVQGGEYGTVDLLRQRTRKARLRAEIDSLHRALDSLRREKRLVESDPALQERVAREEFGMVRGDREILYRFADPAPDTGRAGAERAR